MQRNHPTSASDASRVIPLLPAEESPYNNFSSIMWNSLIYNGSYPSYFERSEFLIATSKKKDLCVRLVLVLVGKKIVRVFD